MTLEEQYNQRNPAVKRLMREACELKNATEEYFARPLDDNLFEWHFTVHGSPSTDYNGGVYHGRILLPPEYPMKPPNIILLTPNGRFETNKKICLSISGHHPETWQPSWSIRTALLALIAFMSSPGRGSIGALDYTPEERKKLAKDSQTWKCDECGPIVDLLCSGNSQQPATQDEQDLVQRIEIKSDDRAKTTDEKNMGSEQQTANAVPTSISQPPTAARLQNNLEPAASMDYNTICDYLLGLFVAALALLIARRMALSMFQ